MHHRVRTIHVVALFESLQTNNWDYVGQFLRDNYVKNGNEARRRNLAIKRDDLYENRGERAIIQLIETAFQSQLNKKLRKDLVEWAKWNNVVARVVREKAMVYSEPARRRITNGDEVYQAFLDRVWQDDAMRELNRKLVLHEDVWVQYRVRASTREPVIDIISPAKFWAIAHPADPTLLVAIILDHTPQVMSKKSTDPHYRVWTTDETFMLDGDVRFIRATYEPWPLGRLPGILATTRQPTAKGQLLCVDASADLVAAAESVWFQNVLLLKESKSASKQTYFSGDVTDAPRGQVNDTETDQVLGEGVQAIAVDRGMDLSQYRDNADHILERVGANHGLPPSVLHHRDAASGAEIHLRRIPLRELRKQQIPPLRRVEHGLVELQSMVNAGDLPEFSFDPEGWTIDFGEIQQPLTEQEALDVFETARRLGLTDTIEEMMRRNPDLDEQAARIELTEHVERETERVKAMKTLMSLSGSVNSSPDDSTPDNGQHRGSQPPRFEKAS